MDALLSLFRTYFNTEPLHTELLTGSGSNRRYYRFTVAPHKTVIGVEGNSKEENSAFIALAQHFRNKNLPVPKVLAVSDDMMVYLLDDLGNVSLFDVLGKSRNEAERMNTDATYNDDEYNLLAKTIRLLPHFQITGAEGLDFSICYPQPEMDEMNVMFDLNYFKYCFLKPSGIDFHEVKLEMDFRSFASNLCNENNDNTVDTFLYRDFQARNVMLVNGTEPYFIDFQGGRKGPIYYDLASFLWQASARYSHNLRQRLLSEYENELLKLHFTTPDEGIYAALQPWLLFRTLQVLGAYGFRGYYEQKQHFINSIPMALSNLKELLENGICKYAYLQQVLEILITKYKI